METPTMSRLFHLALPGSATAVVLTGFGTRNMQRKPMGIATSATNQNTQDQFANSTKMAPMIRPRTVGAHIVSLCRIARFVVWLCAHHCRPHRSLRTHRSHLHKVVRVSEGSTLHSVACKTKLTRLFILLGEDVDEEGQSRRDSQRSGCNTYTLHELLDTDNKIFATAALTHSAECPDNNEHDFLPHKAAAD